MLTVYKFTPAWGLPDISPFVLKLETYLRMAGIEYESKPGDPRKAPKQKLPYVEHDGKLLGDSRFVIDHLESTRGAPLDGRLGPRERAIAQAYRSMIEEHLYFVILYQRWVEQG
ncbi:MAG TPA: Tom37 metaxin N-terminal-like domain-containing protein, partial [Polyangiaceae bacterium]